MRLLSKSEFAALVGRDIRTIERWVAQGRIKPGRLPSGAPVFSDEHIDAILAGEHAASAPKAQPLDANAWMNQRKRRKEWRG